MFFRIFITVFVLLLTVPLISASETKPNVILIYTDDVGFGDVSCNVDKSEIPTPNIDKLAEGGLRFTNAHCTSATCTPSRYALMTGEYPWRKKGTGVLPGNASAIIAPGRFTLASLFQKAGYRTKAVGKWHLGLGGNEGPDWNGIITPSPKEIGFDEHFIIPATVDRVPCVFVENSRVANLDPNDPISVDYQNKIGNEPTATERPDLLKMGLTHGHNNTIINGIGRIGFMSGGKSARWNDETIAEVITNNALDFIKDNQSKPFFLYYATHDIHVPRVPHPKFAGKSGHGARGDVILQLDDCVGQITALLKELKIFDNTLIIFSSDNGPIVDDGYLDGSMENIGNHKPAGPYRGSKYSKFEAGTRVPFIVHWNSRIKPAVSNALFSQIDLLASFAALVQTDIPEGAAPDSINALPVLLGESQRDRDYNIEQASGLTIISKGWKYIPPNNGPAEIKMPKMGGEKPVETGNLNVPQLYKLDEDIAEQKNLAAEHPDIVKELDALLKSKQQN
ncbi:MAG: arylsulfatase [Planctomycetaceae bacterium]|nr:arylsulfatase [Planctomycetaceae bacterium]